MGGARLCKRSSVAAPTNCERQAGRAEEYGSTPPHRERPESSRVLELPVGFRERLPARPNVGTKNRAPASMLRNLVGFRGTVVACSQLAGRQPLAIQ